jgi:hypothetical protein
MRGVKAIRITIKGYPEQIIAVAIANVQKTRFSAFCAYT